MSRDLYKKTSILASIVLVFVICGSLGSLQNAYGLPKTGMIVPLYSYPGNDWNTLVQEKQNHPSVPIVAIINPDSGPGTRDTNYLYGVQKLQSSGIQVIGYIYTANIGYNEITSYINDYKDWYHVNGIFFDQMSNVKGNETFYASLTNYSKSVGLNFTVGNPGIDTLPSYIGTVNNLVIYDNPNLPTVSSFEGWHKNFTKSNFSFIAYNVNATNKTYVENMSRLVQYMFVSNSTLPNPFNSLPGYLDTLMSLLDVPQNNTVFVTVNASTTKGTPLTGLWTVVTFGKNSSSGFTPFTFSAISGNNYTVTLSNFGNYTLDHWDDLTKSNTRTITPAGNLTLTAFYGTNHTIPVNQTSLPVMKKHVLSNQSYVYSAPKSSQVSHTGSIHATISYATGDRAYSYGVSLKIYQDSSQSIYRNIDSISGNPFEIDSLPLGHTYKIEVYANGMCADIEYVRLDPSKNLAPKDLTLHLSPPGGMRPNVFYNDGVTPVANAIVYIKDQDNKTWAMDFTDIHGQTLRFWLEPTIMNNDHYTIDVKIGQHMSSSYWPVFLYPGVAREVSIVTPWPPMVDSLVTVKAYDEQSKLLSAKNSSFSVDLLDNNGNLLSESKINYHGEANFSNLKVGDYVFRLVDPSNGNKWSESKVTIDGTKTSFSIFKDHVPIGMSSNQTSGTNQN
ncbi:Spherulin-4-like protein [Nitrosotalea devaniterrae]|uniref:Spherulin-4-like protein n=1 Tax=Nitrosotalea devaniterrae TaxID=1078905 RepID=A0A128A4J2_9ARCH|nr:Spherulin-4-like protein [Candidatus Nitrosotalea devanaterra]